MGRHVETAPVARGDVRAPRVADEGAVGAGSACLVFCRVGRFVEFRGPQRLLAERALGLRRAFLPRAGYTFAVGFPVPLHAVYEARALAGGFTVVRVRECPVGFRGGGKRRVPAAVLVPVR
ncbi:MAG: hypothetical protein ACREKS_20355 [Candidatus Rokuibacteriota bacterium]